MPIVNNVTRMLDARKISYQAHALPVEKLGAVEAAQHLGVPPNQVFKTIVAIRTTPGKPILAVVPGSTELDLKLLASAVGEKKIKVASHAQAEDLTGLMTGGISPLALVNKGFQIVLDKSILSFNSIFISGGQRGLNIELSPQDLVKLTNARTAAIAS
jgi:Cys-tRNA(Pro)/Cys-tRNA(Cys) deacylase